MSGHLTVPSALLATAQSLDTAPADNLISADELSAGLVRPGNTSATIIDIANLQRLMLGSGVKALVIDPAKLPRSTIDPGRAVMARLQQQERDNVSHGHPSIAGTSVAEQIDKLRGQPRVASELRQRYNAVVSALAANIDDPSASLEAGPLIADERLTTKQRGMLTGLVRAAAGTSNVDQLANVPTQPWGMTDADATRRALAKLSDGDYRALAPAQRATLFARLSGLANPGMGGDGLVADLARTTALAMLQNATDTDLALMITATAPARLRAFGQYLEQINDDTLRDITAARLTCLPPSVGAALLSASSFDYAALDAAMASADADAARNAYDAAMYAITHGKDVTLEARIRWNCPMFNVMDRQRW